MYGSVQQQKETVLSGPTTHVHPQDPGDYPSVVGFDWETLIKQNQHTQLPTRWSQACKNRGVPNLCNISQGQEGFEHGSILMGNPAPTENANVQMSTKKLPRNMLFLCLSSAHLRQLHCLHRSFAGSSLLMLPCNLLSTGGSRYDGSYVHIAPSDMSVSLRQYRTCGLRKLCSVHVPALRCPTICAGLRGKAHLQSV